ncbi:glutaredoxin Grx4 [Schizosaccharomyces japonicus yFS275]|uniref:Glutaredoxin Grx4 n=1 Tax=Schizosaccharomyces japonicus (strain yFS275 / FY16936) TaxID=402676 RepID=B6JWP4_SCHJY|nr:glutaredoxin Grx4 [Schizosaccharomyces japonicus yFS275]EEB05795.1 glutaredoxin Grx4 [Schizosaccharomyces japonicus yFS275]
MSISVDSVEQFQEIVQSNKEKTIILNFYAPWAAPCQQMNQVFDQLATEAPNAVFLKLEAEKLPDVAEIFDVASVPLFVLIKEQQVISRISGANPQKLKEAVDEHVNKLPGAKAADASATKSTSTAASNTSAAPTAVKETAAVSAVESGEVRKEGEQESEQELNARLEKLTRAHDVMLFMKGIPSEPACGFSRKIVALLREQGVQYGYFNILADNSVRQGLKTFSDWPTFPQLYIRGEFVGGLDIVSEMIETGEFQQMINGSA